MIALVYIIFISAAVLGAIHMMLPSDLKPLVSQREYAAAVLLPAIGTFSSNYAVFAVAVISFMALVPATAEQRLRLLLFCIPLLPGFVLTIEAPKPINQLIDINYPLLLLFGCVPAALVLAHRMRSNLSRWDALILLFMGLFVFTASRGTSGTNIVRVTVQQLLSIGVAYFVFSRAAAGVERPRNLLFAFVLVAALIGAIATFESLRNWLLYADMNIGQDLGHLSGYAKQRGGFLRAQTTFSEPTSLSIFLALALILSVAMRREITRRRLRLFLYGVIGCGLFFTFGRVGWLVFAVGIAAVLLFERRYAVAILLLACAPLLWSVLQLAAHASPTIAAVIGTGEGASGTVEYRRLLSARIAEIVRENPLTGVDPAMVTILLGDFRQGEGIIDLINTPLVIAMQAGIFGLLIFLWPTVAACRKLMVRRKRFEPQGLSAASALFAALIALNIGLVTTSLGARNLLWLVLFLATSAGLLSRRLAVTSFERPRGAEVVPAIVTR